jgi:hypothetical protein
MLSQDDLRNISYEKGKSYNKNSRGFYFNNKLKLSEFTNELL